MSERFFCPFEGCRRSFAELWRLKVHARAPPDIRGSGRERGHGEELKHCPRCQAPLLPGRHHIRCGSGKLCAPRQAAKRMQVRKLPEAASTASGTRSARFPQLEIFVHANDQLRKNAQPVTSHRPSALRFLFKIASPELRKSLACCALRGNSERRGFFSGIEKKKPLQSSEGVDAKG